MKEHEKLLGELIEIKSLSGQEGELRGHIQTWFQEKGIDSFLQDDNLIVHFEGKDPTRAFIFNSHMDTVSEGDLDWKYGPWTPTKVENKFYGLGASDMKSGLAASMLLAEEINKSGKPAVDMWFTYVTNEEVDGTGTKNFAEWFSREGYPDKYKDMAGIFTEPSGLIEIEHGHRGNIFIKVTTNGDSGHGSRPDLIKQHSVRKMIKFANTLQKTFKTWREEFSGSEFEPPTVGEMTSIQAGDCKSPNKFPSICVATFDVRTTPDFHKVAFDRITELGKKLGAKIDYAFPPAPAGYTDPNEKIVKVTQRLVKGSELTVSKGSADLGFLTTQGVKAIIFGPGEKLQAHKLNEYCYPDQIPMAVEIYQAIVEAWAK